MFGLTTSNKDDENGIRRSLRVRRGKLRPCVLLPDDPEEEWPDETFQFDTIPDALLIVGTTLRNSRLQDLVKGLANAMHEQQRRVIYIGLDRPPKKPWGAFIDICLLVDPQEWSRRQLSSFHSESPVQHDGTGILESVSARAVRFS